MLFAQLTHAIGLNDVCDALRLHSGPLSALRGATAPSRNNLSHANKRRDAALAERLFWTVLEHLQKLSPGFAAGRRGKGLARRFRRVIHVVDSSTIALIASCIDWAQHRRRKPPPSSMYVWTCTVYCRALSWSNRQRRPTVFAPRNSAPESNRARSLSLIAPTLISSTWVCSMAMGSFG